MALTFFSWASVAFVVVPHSAIPTPKLGLILVGGLPVAMGLLSAVYLLGLMARTTVDDEGLTIAGPLGTRSARWADVVGWDVVGTAQQGVTLDLRNGRRLGVPFLAYEGDGLRRAVDARLRRLPKADVEGREFRMASRWGLSGLLLGTLVFFAAAGTTLPVEHRGQGWLMLGLMALVILPLVALTLSDRVVLQDGVLTGRNLLGARRLTLAEVTRAELRVVNGKGGAREMLILTGPKVFRLSAQRDGYAMLRDAIVRELPRAVRPKPLA